MMLYYSISILYMRKIFKINFKKYLLLLFGYIFFKLKNIPNNINLSNKVKFNIRNRTI